ncbi:MAG: hypothetical protein U9Q21_02475 [Candidatus Auribacterota bacterium]|nr:hypothetical protein [Candidatus Auribacterota bacterium]
MNPNGTPFPRATHSELVSIAIRYLKRKWAVVIISEMSGGGGEEADAIGWISGFSTMIECKASISDFKADSKKPFRRIPENGMGNYRYYLTPPGLKIEVPDKWGHIVWAGKQYLHLKKAEFQESSDKAENLTLLSLIRRIGRKKISGCGIRAYTYETKNKARCYIDVCPECPISA